MQSLHWHRKKRETIKDSYDQDGFVVIPGFLLDNLLADTQRAMQELITEKISEIPSEKVYYEEKGNPESLKQIQQLFNYHPFFDEMMYRSRFTALAALLLGEEAIGKNLQYFNKPPAIGKPTPPHQDGYYFMLEPPSALTMWLAMDHVNEENGCVRYVRGSHLAGMRPHGRTNVLGFSQGMLDFGKDSDRANTVFFETEPGDLLVHHALTVHWADGNNSRNRTRRALGLIYYGESAREDKEAHEAYQARLARELKERKIL